MELVKGKNSYMDLEEANSIINDIFFDDEEEAVVWNGLSDDDKTKLIYRATRLVDNLVFIGTQYYPGEQLKWPRLIQCRYTECPGDVKVAILAQGIKDKQDKTREEEKLKELGVKTYSIKGASISFGDNNKYKLTNGIYSSIFDLYLSKWVY